MTKKTDKKPTKPTKLSKNKRTELVKEEFIKTGGTINCSEFSKQIGCHRTTITKDIERVKNLIKKESIEKYSNNILQEIMQGQGMTRLVLARSVQTKDKHGNLLKDPILLCTEDALLDRLRKANLIRESDITIMEAWGLKDKVAEESNVTVKQGIPDWLPDAEKALKKKNDRHE